MSITNSNLPILSTPITTDYYTQWAGSVSDVRTLLATTGTNLLQGYSSTGEHIVFDNGLLRIKIEVDMAYNQYRLQTISFINLQTNKATLISNPNYRNSLYLCLGYDDSIQTAYFFMVGQFDYNGAWTQKDYGTFSTNRQDIYEAISGSQIPTYQWSSVPAISGKNGILSLPTLIDTDGNPISGQSASVFSSLPEGSNVRALINGAL